MLHRDCKTPQLPDSDLKRYMLKVQGETLPADSDGLIDAKEEQRKRITKDSSVALPLAVEKATRPKKRSKIVNPVDSEDDVEIVKPKDLKNKVMQ